MTPKILLIAFGIASSVLLSACDRKGSAPANTGEAPPSSTQEEITESSDAAPASSSALPSLRLNGHEQIQGDHKWVLTGNRIGKLTIRLLFVSNGRSTIASESVLTSKGGEGAKEAVQIRLRAEDPQPSIVVSCDNLIAQTGSVDQSATFPEGLLRLAATAMEENRTLDSQSTELLYLCGYRTKGTEAGSFGTDLESDCCVERRPRVCCDHSPLGAI